MILEVTGLPTTEYMYEFSKMQDNEHYNLTLSDFTSEFVSSRLNVKFNPNNANNSQIKDI